MIYYRPRPLFLATARRPRLLARKARRAPFPFIPLFLLQLARMGVEPGHRREAVVLRLERAISSGPIDERAIVGAHVERKWVGRRSNPRLLVFSQALYRLSYRPSIRFFFPRSASNKKGPVSRDTRPLVALKPIYRPSVTSAMDARGYSLRAYLAARNNPHLCILESNSAVKTSLKSQLHVSDCCRECNASF